jgi:hypothetical protein
MPVDQFLGVPGAALSDPQVLYDDVGDQFLVESADATSVLIASTTSGDACGTWHISAALPLGAAPTSVEVGQDARALLVTVNLSEGGLNLVAAISKADLYAGLPPASAGFSVRDVPKPATTAGNPTIDTPDGYFLAAEGAGKYNLYTMTGDGDAETTLQVQPISAVPNPAGLDLGMSLPTFDGSRVWFTQLVEASNGFMTRYGYVNVATNFMTTGVINGLPGDTNTSSIAVSPGADGTVSVFLDWLTEGGPGAGRFSDSVKSFIYPGSGPLPGNALSDQQVAVFDTPSSFGSSAAIDPGTADGICAVTAQPDGLTNGTWTTLVRRKCGPFNVVQVPSVVGDSPSAALSVMVAAFLTPEVFDIGTPGGGCDASTAGTIFAQDPAPGTVVSAGVPVHLQFCDLTAVTVPNVIGDTPDQARAALQAVGLADGQVTTTADCGLASDGLITDTNPAVGSQQLPGTAISLQECVRTVTVPDVSGDTLDQAEAELQGASLTPGSVSHGTSCDVPAGTVIRTSPKAGDKEAPGTIVSLVVSTGRPATCN